MITTLGRDPSKTIPHALVAHRPMEPITTRGALIDRLAAAAQWEHAITCQYLFAAFSLETRPQPGRITWPQAERTRAWKAELLLIARQEMEHHGLVCNLLTAICGAPHFGHPRFPFVSAYVPEHPVFELRRFGPKTLARLVYYETVHDAGESGAGESGALTVGGLYQQIRRGLLEVERRTPRLFMGRRAHQVTNADLGLTPGHFDLDLRAVIDVRSAVAAIDRLLDNGHGARLRAIEVELAALRDQDPGFEPAHPVAPNPVLDRPEEGGPAEVSVVEHPVTRLAARLFGEAYQAMSLMLDRFHAPPSDQTPGERETLLGTAFFPLMTMVIRPLGEVLCQMPLRDEPEGPTAGPIFAYSRHLPSPPDKLAVWVYLHERLQELAAASDHLAGRLPAIDAPWARAVAPRLAFLAQGLARIAGSFERGMGLRERYVQHMLERMR
ncbi:MAG: hypothetical protein KDK70_01580 [Myxococcales bacterium]|nr:hypothetical protein [Myxococcales bacterium]